MSTFTKNYASMTIKQLKSLIEDCNDNAEIRIWVEMLAGDSVTLEGRRLVSVINDPYDKYVCFVAGYYNEADSE